MQPLAPKWIERRSWPRRRNQLRVEVLDPEDVLEHPYRGWVVDRSRGGLRLVVKHAFSEGAILNVLPVGAPASTPWVEVQVRHCRRRGSGWELGCRFLSRPSVLTLLLFG
jgi:hypothetical protein